MSELKVLLVRPQPSRGLGAFYRNLGVTMLATYLHAYGMAPVLADLTFDAYEPLLACGAAVAAFSLYIDDFAEGARLASAAQSAGLRTIVGGPHATLLGTDALEAASGFDAIGVGDCLPEAMPAIIALAEDRHPPQTIIGSGTGQAMMDTLPPDYSIWPGGDRYFPVFPVEFSRGCRQHCPFCTDPVLRRGVAVNPVDRTMKTLRRLAAAHDPVSGAVRRFQPQQPGSGPGPAP